MTYRIILSELAKQHLSEWKQSGKLSVLKKMAQIFRELEAHPMTGIGKPERLKGTLSGFWSRRITKSDRIVYSIDGENIKVDVVSAKGHYGDK